MKILSWNYRGLGKPSAVIDLRQIIKAHHPDLIFLTETKLQKSDFLLKSKSFGNTFSNFVVDCTISPRNRSGGLALFWSNNVNITIIGYNNNMIDCYVESANNGNYWRATGIYGFPQHANKTNTCDLISSLYNSNYHDQWLLFGDYNLIVNAAEKQGGRENDNNNYILQDTLNSCNLVDLAYKGDPYTWTNNQATNCHIKERLDRFGATTEWISRFPRFTNYHLIMSYTSDHNPILLVFGTNMDFRNDSHNKHHMKRFENIWLNEPECLKIIKDSWEYEAGETHNKLKTTLEKVHQWGKATFGNIPSEIKSVQSHLAKLKIGVPTTDQIKQIKSLESKLDTLLQKEEQWWSQRAKSNWLQHGDKNSKFFHFKASQRNKRNTINFITDSQGNKHSQNKDIQVVFQHYFDDIFTTSNPTNMQEYLQVVANRIHPQMGEYLGQDFTTAEVYFAAHQLKGNAAPGPDGLNANFYQSLWNIIGEEVTHSALNILSHGGNPESLNTTHICLIPKHNNPTTPADYRPIALCNVILKIITKTIANRIKHILPNIISPQQSAFLPGRLITDNTLLAFETFHHLKHKKNKIKGYVGIKLDMAKAYDILESSFISNTLSTMGFPSNLVHTIMMCVSTVSYSILVNGQPSPYFKPHRGIRQGDPISP
jgi:exonuclease III